MAFKKKLHICTFADDRRAETAITHMIFFITAILLAMTVVAVMTSNVQSLTSATVSNGKVLSEQLKTDITIISDPELIPYDTTMEQYTFYAKNTGKTELDSEYLDVLIDGLYVYPDELDISLFDQDVLWRPGDLLMINVTVTEPLSDGDHRLLIAAENGRSDSMDFRI
ncbi:flagellin [Methanococcoides burtonii]|uniref:Archaeal flagellar protein G n=1 Tax=Methanococcoides burtonii (strain DSM 6242 / NBRC 107633 / OCM 468 / ACE-M) TaxID=259564 RepID=Q12VP9_METBU|nr:flagellin [Methanococcoides burtonii]ABE52477.1 Archaeal flagellar protein G [Methanococcoides burtonii DSM 6242]